jgi:hypothetical protein
MQPFLFPGESSPFPAPARPLPEESGKTIAISRVRRLAMKKFVLCGILFAIAGTLDAQEFPRYSFTGGAGFTTPLGNTGNNLDTGWNIRAGGGVKFSPYLGAMLDCGLDFMDVTPQCRVIWVTPVEG